MAAQRLHWRTRSVYFLCAMTDYMGGRGVKGCLVRAALTRPLTPKHSSTEAVSLVPVTINSGDLGWLRGVRRAQCFFPCDCAFPLIGLGRLGFFFFCVVAMKPEIPYQRIAENEAIRSRSLSLLPAQMR